MTTQNSSTPPATTTSTTTTPCVRPGCKRKGSPKRRGLCFFDHKVALAQIKAGNTSWLALEAAGKVLPAPPRKTRTASLNATKAAEDWFKV